jgi:hypothetical protein
MPDTYRSKPVTVHAVRWTGYNETEIRNFIRERWYVRPVPNGPNIVPVAHPPRVWCSAKNRWCDIDDGDWIICNGKGYEVLTDTAFRDRYEPAARPALTRAVWEKQVGT